MNVLYRAIISIVIITESFTALYAQEFVTVQDSTKLDEVTALIRKIDSIKSTDSIGVEMISPHYRALRDGSKSSIPEN